MMEQNLDSDVQRFEKAAKEYMEWCERKDKEYEEGKAWLKEKREELSFDVSLEDIDYAFADVLRVLDMSGKVIYKENFLDPNDCDTFLLEVFGHKREQIEYE
jgi:hypothetical protein